MKKWRNHLRIPHIAPAHAAELAALILAFALGLSVDTIACHLLRALDDDDPWDPGATRVH